MKSKYSTIKTKTDLMKSEFVPRSHKDYALGWNKWNTDKSFEKALNATQNLINADRENDINRDRLNTLAKVKASPNVSVAEKKEIEQLVKGGLTALKAVQKVIAKQSLTELSGFQKRLEAFLKKEKVTLVKVDSVGALTKITCVFGDEDLNTSFTIKSYASQ
jgi:hypothetical protein